MRRAKDRAIGNVSLVYTLVLQRLNLGETYKIEVDNYLIKRLSGTCVQPKDGSATWNALNKLLSLKYIKTSGTQVVGVPRANGVRMLERPIYGITPEGLEYLLWCETVLEHILSWESEKEAV